MAVAMAADVAVVMAVQGVARAAVDAMAVAAVRRVVMAPDVVMAQDEAMAGDADAAAEAMTARLQQLLGSRPALHARAAKRRQPMELLVLSATAIAAARVAETLQAEPRAAANRALRLPRPNRETTGRLTSDVWEPAL
jgi:hypothetical protein